MGSLRLVLILALRSLLAHRVKSVVVGGLLLFGTFLVVVGNALLGSIEHQMEQTITGSLAGHLQLYAKDAKDPLSLFGAFGSLGSTDIGEIPAIEEVVPDLQKVPHVVSVVPMGISNATIFGRNDIDQVLADLRDAVRAPGTDRTLLVGRLQRIVTDLATESENLAAIGRADEVDKATEALRHVSEPTFWRALESPVESDALGALDYLDSRIAPLASDGRMLYLRVFGTDPAQFATSFPRFHVVKGKEIPPGKPGFLFSNRTYEELVKNPVAVELDKLEDAVVRDGKSIAADPLLQQDVARNAKQYRRITFQLDPDEAKDVDAWLATELPDVQGDLDAKVRAFLTVTDETIDARRTAFYEHIAPKIDLYPFAVGSTITLRGFSRSGYMKAVEVPIYGTYEFTGLEDAGFQTASNLVDLVTFRELYGKMSERDMDELASIRQTAGVADVSREDAEAALFGGAATPVKTVETPAQGVDVDLAAVVAPDPWARTYPPEDLRHGLALNIAVILDDPRNLAEAWTAIAPVADAHGLQIVDWQTAAGMIGQFIVVMRMVLVVGLGIVFLVALIIVNNSMVMATLDRVPEIGTLRAIGAQRTTVVGLFLAETALLGLFAGAAGAGLALAFVGWLHATGIPAPAPILVVLFGGPRLYPVAGLSDVLFGLAAITLVAVASTLYPALLAARVPPVVAMQGRE